MARALRVVVTDGWYHVTARGNRREAIFLNEEDRRRFLGLVSELPERFWLEVHAYVLMSNHDHLLVRTPEGNLRHAIRWLNVGRRAGAPMDGNPYDPRGLWRQITGRTETGSP